MGRSKPKKPKGRDWGPFAEVLNHDLNGRKLTSDEKKWLVNESQRVGVNAASVARDFNIPHQNLTRWAKTIDDDGLLHHQKGSPPKVDATGEAVLLSHIEKHQW